MFLEERSRSALTKEYSLFMKRASTTGLENTALLLSAESNPPVFSSPSFTLHQPKTNQLAA